MKVIPVQTHEILDWDSDIFGLRVARLLPDSLSIPAVDEAVRRLQQDGVRLAYAVCDTRDSAAHAAMSRWQARRVDHKLTFRFDLPVASAGMAGVGNLAVEPWQDGGVSPELEALALDSGQYSRFKLDPDMPAHVFAAIYLQWIRRSVAGKLADVVLVVRDGPVLAGMVTLAVHAGLGRIGLVAVAPGCRRRGVGRALLQGALAWAHDHGASALDVVTQGNNGAACALYRSCAGRTVTDQAVYHLWLEATT